MQKIKLAQAEGRELCEIDDAGRRLALELEFRYVCDRWIGEDLFHGSASTLAASFDDTQRRFLFYMLRKVTIEYRREHRRDIADRDVFVEEREQGLA